MKLMNILTHFLSLLFLLYYYTTLVCYDASVGEWNPKRFKFGATNGKIILFAVVFGIGGIVALVSNFIDMTSVINMINGLDNYSLIAIPIISVILLGISYLISNKIYQNKEF